MSPTDRSAAAKRPTGRARRFQLPVVREIAPVAHGPAGGHFRRHTSGAR